MALAAAARANHGLYRRQTAFVIGAVLLSAIPNALFHLGVVVVPGIDPTPLFLAPSGLLAAIALFRLPLTGISPLASSAIVRTMDDMALVLDVKDRLIDFNRSARLTIGIDPNADIGRSLGTLPEPWPGVLVPYLQSDSARDTIRVDLPERTRWYHLGVSPLREEVGERRLGRLFLLHEVTERKEAEETLRKSREQLLQSRRMEAIGRLAGGIAHDFNNLLTVIDGYCGMLEDALPDEGPQKSQLVEITRAARRASTLTAQLLAFSRRQVLQPRVIEVNALVGTMEGPLRTMIGERVELSLVLQPDAGLLRADPGQIAQVITNLAANACDAMPAGGKLTIATSRGLLDAAFLRAHPEVLPREYVCISVNDTGIGMNGETLARIFEPFFTTKETGMGAGLGLPTAYGIVKQSEGYIYCSSAPGLGTTFSLYFPRVSGEKPDELSAPPPTASLHGGETILLVEDEDSVRRYMGTLLAKSGYTVIDVASGAEALEAAAGGRRIHLLITDIQMPQMSGRELAREIVARIPGTKLLYISGFTDDSQLQQDITYDGINFIQKPFKAVDFLEKVRAILAQRSGAQATPLS